MEYIYIYCIGQNYLASPMSVTLYVIAGLTVIRICTCTTFYSLLSILPIGYGST